jgi:hypothetical protein
VKFLYTVSEQRSAQGGVRLGHAAQDAYDHARDGDEKRDVIERAIIEHARKAGVWAHGLSVDYHIDPDD